MTRPVLIDGWRQSWRLKSMRAAALLAVASLLQAELLPMLRIDFPSRAWPYVSLAFAGWIMWQRLVAQPGVLDDASRQPAVDTFGPGGASAPDPDEKP